MVRFDGPCGRISRYSPLVVLNPSQKGIFLGYPKEMPWVKEHKNLVVGVCTFCPETRFSTEGKIGKPSENQRELDDLFDHISARLICTSATAE